MYWKRWSDQVSWCILCLWISFGSLWSYIIPPSTRLPVLQYPRADRGLSLYQMVLLQVLPVCPLLNSWGTMWVECATLIHRAYDILFMPTNVVLLLLRYHQWHHLQWIHNGMSEVGACEWCEHVPNRPHVDLLRPWQNRNDSNAAGIGWAWVRIWNFTLRQSIHLRKVILDTGTILTLWQYHNMTVVSGCIKTRQQRPVIGWHIELICGFP